MEILEIIMIFLVIMASLAIILKCAFGSFLGKKEIHGIPVNVIRNLGAVWKDTPGILKNLPAVVEEWNMYNDERTKDEQEREIRMGQYAMLEKEWKKSGYVPEPVDSTIEEFQLWAVLIAKYPME